MSYNDARRRLKLTENGHTTELALDDIAGADVEAYTLVDLSDDCHAVYTVQLCGRQSVCDCPAAEKWGHRMQCVHVAALLVLKRLGRI